MQKQIKEILKTSKKCLLGKWPHRYTAYNLNIKENQNLKYILILDNFFDFNIKNNGNLVYEHQIVAYYFCGGIDAFKRGYLCDSSIYEVHHINGNTFDNRSSNLQYLPKDLHIEITTVQRSLCKYLKSFRSDNKGANLLGRLNNIPMWNKQGRKVENIKHFILSCLIKTIKESSITFNKIINKNYFSLWCKKISKCLSKLQPIWHPLITWVS